MNECRHCTPYFRYRTLNLIDKLKHCCHHTVCYSSCADSKHTPKECYSIASHKSKRHEASCQNVVEQTLSCKFLYFSLNACQLTYNFFRAKKHKHKVPHPQIILENLLSLPNRSSPVMQVTSDYPGTLYLRGSAYNRFTGSTWERGEEREWDESVLYPYLRFNGQSYSSYYLPIYQLSVKTTYREVQLFTAYEAMSLPPGGVLTGDEYLRNADRRTAYTMTFTQPYQVSRSGGVNLDMSGLNPEYEQWVQDN